MGAGALSFWGGAAQKLTENVDKSIDRMLQRELIQYKKQQDVLMHLMDQKKLDLDIRKIQMAEDEFRREREDKELNQVFKVLDSWQEIGTPAQRKLAGELHLQFLSGATLGEIRDRIKKAMAPETPTPEPKPTTVSFKPEDVEREMGESEKPWWKKGWSLEEQGILKEREKEEGVRSFQHEEEYLDSMIDLSTTMGVRRMSDLLKESEDTDLSKLGLIVPTEKPESPKTVALRTLLSKTPEEKKSILRELMKELTRKRTTERGRRMATRPSPGVPGFGGLGGL